MSAPPLWCRSAAAARAGQGEPVDGQRAASPRSPPDLAVAFLTRYFETHSLTPFAVYCALAGLGGRAYFITLA
ncbi:hypothetical protein AB0N14_33815 [Streptomyces sp. NPDC051104]|uniref:hypothetical protein n=1 Tax=Streptomyces sp. NPDC051104 TaxID=3155044 RepID=UPI003412B71F